MSPLHAAHTPCHTRRRSDVPFGSSYALCEACLRSGSTSWGALQGALACQATSLPCQPRRSLPSLRCRLRQLGRDYHLLNAEPSRAGEEAAIIAQVGHSRAGAGRSAQAPRSSKVHHGSHRLPLPLRIHRVPRSTAEAPRQWAIRRLDCQGLPRLRPTWLVVGQTSASVETPRGLSSSLYCPSG